MLKPFRHVDSQLKSQYKRAVRVKSKRWNTKLRNWNANSYPFTSDDLVYGERTTDLCAYWEFTGENAVLTEITPTTVTDSAADMDTLRKCTSWNMTVIVE